jgi:hypothetical protein
LDVSGGWEKEIFSFLMTDVVCFKLKQQQLKTNQKLRTFNFGLWVLHRKSTKDG